MIHKGKGIIFGNHPLRVSLVPIILNKGNSVFINIDYFVIFGVLSSLQGCSVRRLFKCCENMCCYMRCFIPEVNCKAKNKGKQQKEPVYTFFSLTLKIINLSNCFDR